jgi:opacity protein-like surface antigen
MHKTVVWMVAALAVLAGAAPAAAQQAPEPGTWALSSLDRGIDVSGAFEMYLTPRVAVRGQLGGSWFDVSGRDFAGTVTPVRLDGNIVYKWLVDVWQPYITAGLGLYRYRSSFEDSPTSDDTKLGVNVGGGVEYFIAPQTAVTGEVLYHDAGALQTPEATFAYGAFWTVEIGLKVYGGR